jgi:hypothetical protein
LPHGLQNITFPKMNTIDRKTILRHPPSVIRSKCLSVVVSSLSWLERRNRHLAEGERREAVCAVEQGVLAPLDLFEIGDPRGHGRGFQFEREHVSTDAARGNLIFRAPGIKGVPEIGRGDGSGGHFAIVVSLDERLD